MKKRILLLTLIMCLLGGVNLKTLNAQTVVTISGDATKYKASTTENAPIKTYNRRSYSQSIYLKEELNMGESASISSISFKVSSSVNSFPFTRSKIRVYLTNTELSEFTNTDMVKLSSEDLYYSEKELTFNSAGWITITLDENFEYTGKNILVSVWDNTGSYIESTYFESFEPKSGDEKRCAYNINNSADPTVSDISGNLSAHTPQIQFTYSSSTSISTPPTVTLNTPENGATGIFNPSLNFTLGDAKQYQIKMAEGTGAFEIVQDWTDGNGSISYQTNLLKSNTAYSWKVVAKNDVGETTSEVYTFTTKNFAAPGGLTKVSPENNAQDLINPTLEWTFGENTEEQQLLIDGEVKVDWTNIGIKTSDSYQTSGLTAGSHTWQVNTRNGEGTTTGTEYSFTVVTLPDNVTPISPANGATNVSSNVIRWQFADNTTEYRFLYGEAEDQLAYCGHGTEYEWLEVTTDEVELEAPYFESGKTYYWAVDVQNSIGQRTVHQGGDPISIFSFTTASVLNTTYKSPENGATNIANPILTWNYNGTPDYYQVLMGTAENELVAKTDWLAAEGTGGTFQTENLNNTTRYYWQVNIKNGETVMEGEKWSFVTTLPAPTNVAANPAQIVPTLSMTYGSTTISWDDMGATGYNVYLGATKLNAELITATSYEIADNTMKLSYNMEPGHDIYVQAIYAIGESNMSEAVYVKVTGYANVNGYVKDESGNGIEGVTVTYSGTDDFEQPYTIVFTTGADGQYSGTVLVGRYSITAVKEDYLEHSAEAKYFGNGETVEETITLVNKLAFDILISTNTAMELEFNLTNAAWYDLFKAPEGDYTIYLRKENDVVKEYGPVRFIYINNVTLCMRNEDDIQEFNSIWADLPNGTYNVGVEIYGKNYINWSEDIERNYHIFMASNNNNDWNDELNWFGGLPEEATDNVTLRASVVVAEESDITVADVMIEGSAALTINGTLNANDVTITKDASLVINGILNANDVTITKDASLVINGILKANDVINQGAPGKLLINDGGQLYRTATTLLRGKFVKNIKTPSNWETTKDGWQLMASPFTNEDGTYTYFTQFTNVATGDYDLYNYNGSALKEWINIKDTETNGDTFGTTFVNGTGYLVAHKSAKEVALTGTFKSGTSYTIENLVYDAEKDLANFHLLGNPFPFNMDWSNVKGNRLVEGFAVLNEKGDNYEYKTSGTIKVGEGFFIRTRAAEGTELGLPSFTHSITRGAEKETVNSLNVIATGNVGKDNVVINFAGESEGFPKLQNFNDAIATVYVQDKGAKYGIYNCDENTTEVELCFNANQMGNYTISVEDSEEFEAVILVDRFTGIETNMLLEDYTFTAMSDVNNNRFILKLAVSDQQSAVSDNFVYQSGEELIVEAEGRVQIIDMMGRVVYNNDVTSDNNRINVSDFNNGAYVVRVINESEIKVEKVVIY